MFGVKTPHPTEEAHFSRSYPRPQSFSNNLVTGDEGWNKDRPVRQKLRLPVQLRLRHNDCVTDGAAPIRPQLIRSFVPVNKCPAS